MASPVPMSRSPSPQILPIGLKEPVSQQLQQPAASLPPAPVALPRYLDHHPTAPLRTIPQTALLSVEYPGFIEPSPASLQRALFTIGGPKRLDTLLAPSTAPSLSADRKAPAGNTAALTVVELNYGLTSDAPEVVEAARWRHPIMGQIVEGDKLVLRVKKRRKVRVNRETGARERLEAGEYTMEVLGPVASTVRFRNIADHQWYPPTDTATANYLAAMRTLNYKELLTTPFPPETESYTAPIESAPRENAENHEERMDVDSDLPEPVRDEDGRQRPAMRSTAGIFPPPMFSMQRVPWRYHYKPNPYSNLVAMSNPTDGYGEQQRLSNKSKNKIVGVNMVKFKPDVVAPTAPPANWVKKDNDEDFFRRVQDLFKDPGTVPGVPHSRPIWSRTALANQFSMAESGVKARLKMLLPGIAYTFEGGAYRDLMVRLGYDPRLDPENGPSYQGARLRSGSGQVVGRSQTRSFLGSHNVRHYTSSLANQKLADVLPGGDIRKTHLFDGEKLHRDWQNFQLCDISEPELAELIADPDGRRPTCFGEDGWYKPVRYTLIREILRKKFNHLLAHGKPLPDGECDELRAAAEAEQARQDAEAAGVSSESEGEMDWIEEHAVGVDNEDGDGSASQRKSGKSKGKGRAEDSSPNRQPRASAVPRGRGQGKRPKTLSSLINPGAKALRNKTAARTRARQVGVTDAMQMAERLQRDLAREAQRAE